MHAPFAVVWKSSPAFGMLCLPLEAVRLAVHPMGRLLQRIAHEWGRLSRGFTFIPILCSKLMSLLIDLFFVCILYKSG